MTYRAPKSATFEGLSEIKKAAVRRRVSIIEDQRLQDLFEQEAVKVGALTDAEAAAELGVNPDGTDKTLPGPAPAKAKR